MSDPSQTPMMRQYLELKATVPDALLLYRMGDFYELFFEDARDAANILELTLTSRNKKDPDPIPMAGIPHHALNTYMKRLVDAGRKVAIAEQEQAPTTSKAGRPILTRKLVRVVTPGLPWDVDDLEARQHCFLAGISGKSGPKGLVGIAFLEVSTGELRVTEVEGYAKAAAEIVRLEPQEVVLAPEAAEQSCITEACRDLPTTQADGACFDVRDGRNALIDLLGTHDLCGFGAEDLGPSLAATGALLVYARDTARVDLSHIRSVRPYSLAGHMVLDNATRRNLEVLRPLHGTGRKGTLLGLIDRSCTPMGGRLLREWLQFPLLEKAPIVDRQDAVEALLDNLLRRNVRTRLRLIGDVERLSSKAAQGTANGRDLRALEGALRALPGVMALLESVPAMHSRLPCDMVEDVAVDVDRWLVVDPPITIGEGGLIASGVHEELDELVTLAREGKGAIARIEARERDNTGINSLKIKHNRVFGYFLEVTQSNLERVPEDWIRKQTLANCERFVTAELKEFEERVLGADEKRKALELELFRQLRDRVAEQVVRLQTLAHAIAQLDAVSALAEVAVINRYTRPVVDDSTVTHIVAGRHPVVETMGLEERFVPNDVTLGDPDTLMILTGPNMAGKSTVMRQVALMQLMAQIGSFVPADEAHLGMCDRIFVRVGASDDLAHGRSTFMVEMSETALILNHATERSLVVLDEIGRGTSTYDGLSIAWAVAETIHDQIRARTIFATHYHELVSLGEQRERVSNVHLAVSEWGDRIVFLRRLKQGGASKSYGIQCARLAGMPEGVVDRARQLLVELERLPRTLVGPQLSLFTGACVEAEEETLNEGAERKDAAKQAMWARVMAVDPDRLTPREALSLVYELLETSRDGHE